VRRGREQRRDHGSNHCPALGKAAPPTTVCESRRGARQSRWKNLAVSPDGKLRSRRQSRPRGMHDPPDGTARGRPAAARWRRGHLRPHVLSNGRWWVSEPSYGVGSDTGTRSTRTQRGRARSVRKHRDRCSPPTANVRKSGDREHMEYGDCKPPPRARSRATRTRGSWHRRRTRVSGFDGRSRLVEQNGLPRSHATCRRGTHGRDLQP